MFLYCGNKNTSTGGTGITTVNFSIMDNSTAPVSVINALTGTYKITVPNYGIYNLVKLEATQPASIYSQIITASDGLSLDCVWNNNEPIKFYHLTTRTVPLNILVNYTANF